MGRGVRLALVLVVGLAVAFASLACDRNVEPYDPNEAVEQPDLSRIFPEGAERSGDADTLRGTTGGGPPAAPRGPSPAGATPLRGTIRVGAELVDRVPRGAVLFLIARTGESGPPTAVQRIASPSFPLDFSIGPEDRMIAAMPFEGPFQLTARLDADGDATSRNPGDLQGEADGAFSPGATDIEIVIDEVL